MILNSIDNSPLDPTSTMSEADVVTGIPAIVNSLIMVPFSIFFHYAYSVSPYVLDRPHSEAHGAQRRPHYRGGPLGIRAFADMFDPGELLGAVASVFRMGKRRGTSWKAGRGAERAFDTVASRESHEAGPTYEMNRRERQRRGEKGHVRPEQQRAQPAYSGYGWADGQSRR